MITRWRNKLTLCCLTDPFGTASKRICDNFNKTRFISLDEKMSKLHFY